jgi:4-aminobutyrate aminotransferase-like enzyme
MERAWAGSQGGTYGGNAVACAAAVATLDVIDKEGLVENAATLGAHLMDALRVLQQRYPVIGDVRGKGLMVATEFTTRGEPDATRAKHMQAAVERRRLLMLTCGPLGNVIRWIPPLIVTREQIDQALGIFEEALASTAEEER